jgi:hypothetical protein
MRTHPNEPFLSTKLRIGRATELLDTLQADSAAFFNANPFEFFVERDADGVSDTYKCRLTKTTPVAFDFLAVEIIEHLRASLDYLAYTAAELGGRPNSKSCHFPIAPTFAKLESDVIGRQKCKDLPPDILALFRSFEPYKGGKGAAIWMINELCNIGKHRFLTNVGLVSASVEVTLQQLPLGGRILPLMWDSEKDEVSYFSLPAGVKFDRDIDATFFVAFGPSSPLAGKPVVPHLDALIRETLKVIKQTELEARRIGIVAAKGE